MAKFIFHMGVTLRCYGHVEIEAATVEAATALLTADFVGENISIHETTTDGGQDLAVLDVKDAATGEYLSDWDIHYLPSPHDPAPAADPVHDAALDMLAALRPFARMARCTPNADKRDGECVMRLRSPEGDMVDLTRADFHAALSAIAKAGGAPAKPDPRDVFIAMIARLSASGDLVDLDGEEWPDGYQHDTGGSLDALDELIHKAREISGIAAPTPAEAGTETEGGDND